MPSKLSVEFVAFALCAFLIFRGRIPDVSRLTGFARSLARRPLLIPIAAALAVLAVRAALLPIWPFPRPSIYDEFSYLLQADTFAHGRLTNPPHPLWQFFESIYILQQPTYASKYPPGQALFMALGQWLLGHPWFGVWLSCGLLVAALWWALAGWLPARWALLGTLIALDLCTFSYWMNSYWGGAVAAIGGALVIGAYPRSRLIREGKFAWLFGIGAVILLCTRPYEGFLLVAPTAVFLWFKRRQNRAAIWLPILFLGGLGIAGNAFYNFRVTGHLFRLPYQEYFAQYESVPPLIVMPLQPTKFFRHYDLQLLDEVWARDQNHKARSLRLIPMRAADLYQTASIVFGDPLWLLPFIVVCARVAPIEAQPSARRTDRILLAGAAIEFIFYPHYAAPFTAVLLILLVQSLRHLRIWAVAQFARRQTARELRAFSRFVGSLLGVTLASEASRVYARRTPDRIQAVNARKGRIEADLVARHPGKHVIFVRYTRPKTPHEEWIYNLADIDAQPVIWAQDMGAENATLLRYYAGRTYWMFQPDVDPAASLTFHSEPLCALKRTGMPAAPHTEHHFTAPDTVRDIVIGMSDGLTVPFALAAGLSGAKVGTSVVVLAGLAEIAAGSIAMGLGGYLAARTDSEHYESELRREMREAREIPEVEKAEVATVFEGWGLTPAQIEPIVDAISSDEKRFVDFMMRFELGLEEPDPRPRRPQREHHRFFLHRRRPDPPLPVLFRDRSHHCTRRLRRSDSQRLVRLRLHQSALHRHPDDARRRTDHDDRRARRSRGLRHRATFSVTQFNVRCAVHMRRLD